MILYFERLKNPEQRGFSTPSNGNGQSNLAARDPLYSLSFLATLIQHGVKDDLFSATRPEKDPKLNNDPAILKVLSLKILVLASELT